MDLKSMKLPPPAEKEQCEPCSVMSPREDYPWGLRLHLEAAQLEALGLSELPDVEREVMITAKAKVVSVNTSASAGQKKAHRSVSLQITEMALGAAKAKKSSESVLYGDDKE